MLKERQALIPQGLTCVLVSLRLAILQASWSLVACPWSLGQGMGAWGQQWGQGPSHDEQAGIASSLDLKTPVGQTY